MFEVGDRVVYTGTFTPELQSRYGTVRKVLGEDVEVDWDVKFDGEDLPEGVMPQNLTLIERAAKEEIGTALDTAKSLVYGDRQDSYGHPALDYAKTAKIWSGILGIEVTPLQAIQCMIGVKLSRLTNSPHHRDSWVDIAGYAECGDRIRKYELGEEE